MLEKPKVLLFGISWTKSFAINFIFYYQVDVSKVVISPMPGVVRSVNVKVGDSVSEGQEVLVIGTCLSLLNE